MAPPALATLLSVLLALPPLARGQIACPALPANAGVPRQAQGVGIMQDSTGGAFVVAVAANSVTRAWLAAPLAPPYPSGVYGVQLGLMATYCLNATTNVAPNASAGLPFGRAVALSSSAAASGTCFLFEYGTGPNGGQTLKFNSSMNPAPSAPCPFSADFAATPLGAPFANVVTSFDSSARPTSYNTCPKAVLPAALRGTAALDPLRVLNLATTGRTVRFYGIVSYTWCFSSGTFVGNGTYEMKYGAIFPRGSLGTTTFGLPDPPVDVNEEIGCEWFRANGTSLVWGTMSTLSDVITLNSTCPTSWSSMASITVVPNFFLAPPVVSSSVTPSPSPTPSFFPTPSVSPSSQPLLDFSCSSWSGSTATVPAVLRGAGTIASGSPPTPSGLNVTFSANSIVVAMASTGENAEYCVASAVAYNTTVGSYILTITQPAGLRYTIAGATTLLPAGYLCLHAYVQQGPSSGGLGPAPQKTLFFDRYPPYPGFLRNDLIITNTVPCASVPGGTSGGGAVTSAVFPPPDRLPMQNKVPSFGVPAWPTTCASSLMPLWLVGGRGPAPMDPLIASYFITAGGIGFTFTNAIFFEHCAQSVSLVNAASQVYQVTFQGVSDDDFPKCMWMARDTATNALLITSGSSDCPTAWAPTAVLPNFFNFTAALASPSPSPSTGITSPTSSPSPAASGAVTVSPALSLTPSASVSAATGSPAFTVSPPQSPTPTPSPTVSDSATVGSSATPSPTSTSTLSLTGSPSVSNTATPTISLSRTASASPSFSSTATPSATPSRTPSTTPSDSNTATPSSSVTPSPTSTASLSATPTSSVTSTPTGTSSASPSSSITPSLTPSATQGSVSVALFFMLSGVQPATAIANASVRTAISAAVAGALAACDASPGGPVAVGLVSVTILLAADTGSGAVLFSAAGSTAGSGTRRLAPASGVLAVNATALFASGAAARAAVASAANSTFASRVAQLAQRPSLAALAGVTVSGVSSSSSSSALAAGAAAPAGSAPSSATAAAGAVIAVLVIGGVIYARRRAAANSRKARKLTRAQSWVAARASDPSLPAFSSADAYRNLVAGKAAAATAPRVVVASPLASAVPPQRRANFEPSATRGSSV